MGDPTVTAEGIKLTLSALLAELRNILKKPDFPTTYGVARPVFGGELEETLYIPQDKFIIWRDATLTTLIQMGYDSGTPPFWYMKDGLGNTIITAYPGGTTSINAGIFTGGYFISGLSNNFFVGQSIVNGILAMYNGAWLKDDTATNLRAGIKAGHYDSPSNTISLLLEAENVIYATDKNRTFSDLLGTIAGKLNSADHTKAVHDALLINADTLDTKHLIDIQNEIDADIVAHAGVAAAHHAKYTDGEAVTAMGVKADGNPLNHDKYTDLDVENVITDELVEGQSIDNAIDALIATHAALPNAHHTRLHAMTAVLDHYANYWKLFYSDGAGEIQEVALGAATQVLTSNGAAAAPSFQDAAAGVGGAGTAGVLARWTAADTLGDATIKQNGNDLEMTAATYGIRCNYLKGTDGYSWFSFNNSNHYWSASRVIGHSWTLYGTTKTYDIGTSSLCHDDINADDFQNRSGWKTFDKPLEKLEMVKGKENKRHKPKPEFKTQEGTGGLELASGGYEQEEEIDNASIPDWVHRREKPNPATGEWYMMLDEEGYSVNRMQVLLIQAVQELSQRVKDLEQKLKEKN